MIFISHRGNLFGKEISLENSPTYVDYAIHSGYDVEIDLWITGDDLYLGHDSGQHKISLDWLYTRISKLWIHCKNIEAVEYISSKKEFNYFWHQEDKLTLTSKQYIWAYPGMQPILNSIAVLPEMYNDDISKSIGVCSDEIVKYYKKEY